MIDSGDLLAGRYRLQRRLGSGAMGVVWQATDELLQRQVAIKQLRQQAMLDPAYAEDARERAMREARVAARLHHPNAISVYDVIVDDGLPVLIMEYLPGRSLADILTEQHHLDPEEAAAVGSQAASALAAAHAAGITHRDIKPANLLVAEDGTVKITDFGISHATGDVVLTQTGLMAGTPAYLAPEVARGKQPTASSDVFSLGATLYAAAEGTPPFGAGEDNPLALLHKVGEGAVPPPTQAGRLTPVLESMLRADPDQRITGAQAGDAARAVASGLPLPEGTTEVPVGSGTQTQPSTGTAVMASMPATLTATQTASAYASEEEEAPASPEHTLVAPQATTAPHTGRRRKLLYVLAGLAAVLLVGLGLYAFFGGDPDTGSASAEPVTAEEREQATAEYYGLLPEQAELAWDRLGPELREQGRQQYLDRWSEVSSVTVTSPPSATGDDAVRVEIELSMPDDSVVTELHELTIIRSGDDLLISGDDILRRDTVAPEPDAPQPSPQTPEEQPQPQPDRGTEDEDGATPEPDEEQQEETPPPPDDEEPPQDTAPPMEPPDEEDTPDEE